MPPETSRSHYGANWHPPEPLSVEVDLGDLDDERFRPARSDMRTIRNEAEHKNLGRLKLEAKLLEEDIQTLRRTKGVKPGFIEKKQAELDDIKRQIAVIEGKADYTSAS